MNMCSVRQRPMPSAPNSRALAASSGVSAFARTFRRRISSAQPRIVSKSSLICGGTRSTGAEDHAPGAAVDRDHVALAELVAVERRRSSPSCRPRAPRSRRRTACPSRARRRPRARSCPPWAVRIPCAAIIPWMSSGVVSQRTRITLVAVLAALGRGVGVEDDLPGGGARRGVQALRDDLDAPRSGRSSGAAAGRAGRGRCARRPPRARSGPRRPCRRRP